MLNKVISPNNCTTTAITYINCCSALIIMTQEELKAIFEETESKWDGDNVMQGLLIIAKYFNPKEETTMIGVGHEILYSVDVQAIIDKGLTKEDAVKLRELNWMIEGEYDCLSCFV